MWLNAARARSFALVFCIGLLHCIVCIDLWPCSIEFDLMAAPQAPAYTHAELVGTIRKWLSTAESVSRHQTWQNVLMGVGALTDSLAVLREEHRRHCVLREEHGGSCPADDEHQTAQMQADMQEERNMLDAAGEKLQGLQQHVQQLQQQEEQAAKAKQRQTQCDGCGGEFTRKLQRCGRCKQRHYCCKACQKSDWNKGHKAECHTLRVDR